MSHVRCTFAMLSDRGVVRHTNEDACGALAEAGAFVLCDGMGGAAAGEIASGIAVDAFLQTLASSVPQPAPVTDPAVSAPPEPTDRSAPRMAPQQRLQLAILAANHAVFRKAQTSRSLRGMGTTLVALLLHNDEVWLAHVGDSRCYRLRGTSLDRMTEDHSLVEEQIRAGLLSIEQAASSPVRNIITRAVGSNALVEPEIVLLHPKPGDIYLLASDGLTRELEDAAIAAILNRQVSHQAAGMRPEHAAPAVADPILRSACAALIDAANARGGSDNTTVLLLKIH